MAKTNFRDASLPSLAPPARLTRCPHSGQSRREEIMARSRPSARASGVRSLERGLALRVARTPRPLASVAELAKDTSLPRPTVYRLLDTLSDAGFVSREPATDRYRLTHGVRALSDGCLDDEWVSEIAAPLMANFTREHVWPVTLFTFEAGKMLVR